MGNISDLFEAVSGVKKDWKEDWREDTKADWRYDFDDEEGDTPAPKAPINLTAPSFSGITKVGETLTADPGTWKSDSEVSITYQWYLDVHNVQGNPAEYDLDASMLVEGETNSTYVLDETNLWGNVSVVVTATNDVGSTVFIVDPRGPIDLQPQAPEYDEENSYPEFYGTAQVGKTVSFGNISWRAEPVIEPPDGYFDYEWYADSNLVSGPNRENNSYVPTIDDVGKILSVKVIATNIIGSGEKTFTMNGPVIVA